MDSTGRVITTPHSNMRNYDSEYVSEQVVSGLATGSRVSVDLTLASTYLPGIFAICKVVVLLASMNIMQKLGIHMEQAIFVCAACLYLDRCLSIRYIMDTGACSLCVLVSIGLNASRVSLGGEPGVVSMVSSVVWTVVSVLILYDIHRPVMRYVQIPGVVHLVTSCFCVAYAFIDLDLEIDGIAYTRAVAFTVLCVLWVYTLSLSELRETFNDSFSGCVDRFAMVLVADIYVVSGYVLIAIVSIVWQHRTNLLQKHQTVPAVGMVVGSDLVWGSSVQKNPAYVSSDNGSSDDVDVHAAFRLAQENARKGNHSR
jgi:hypothetical protein